MRIKRKELTREIIWRVSAGGTVVRDTGSHRLRRIRFQDSPDSIFYKFNKYDDHNDGRVGQLRHFERFGKPR